MRTPQGCRLARTNCARWRKRCKQACGKGVSR